NIASSNISRTARAPSFPRPSCSSIFTTSTGNDSATSSRCTSPACAVNLRTAVKASSSILCADRGTCFAADMRTTSIQRRLIAAVVISQLLLAVGLVSVAVYFTRRQLRNAFDAQLQGRAMSIAALVRYSEDPHPSLIFEDDLVPPPLQQGHPDFYEVVVNNGRAIARSAAWPQEMPP